MDILPNGFFDDASLLKGIFNKKSKKKMLKKETFITQILKTML
jgi:hypothetical protein